MVMELEIHTSMFGTSGLSTSIIELTVDSLYHSKSAPVRSNEVALVAL